MKKNFLILIIMAWSLLTAKADAVLPPYTGFPTIFHHVSKSMLEKFPKFWLLHVEDEDGRFVNFDYRLAGDTLIMDKDYVPVVCGYEEKDDLLGDDFLLMSAIRPYGSEYTDTLYYRQEGDKVFCLLPEECREIVIVDYSLKVGDEFTDASGVTYVVTEKRRVGEDRYRGFFYYTFTTTEMTLVSEQTGEEETWVEGLGSKNWGITPYFLMERNKVFAKTGLKPSSASVSIAYGVNLFMYPHVNTDNYKAERADMIGKTDIKTCEFIADTLHLCGVKSVDAIPTCLYAECLIEDDCIDVMMKMYSNSDTQYGEDVCYEAKIPGFKAGVYQVRMPEDEYMTLECKGPIATSMNSVVPSTQEKSISVIKTTANAAGNCYDLNGRRLNFLPITGVGGSRIYIRDGRKVIEH